MLNRSMHRTGLVGLMALAFLLIATPVVAQGPYGGTPSRFDNTEPALGGADCNDPANPVLNCGFETGDFTSWTAVDAGTVILPLQVDPGGFSYGFGFYTTAPTEGGFSVLHGFDATAGTPDTIQVGQDVLIPNGGLLEFDYRGAWDLQTFGATMDRTFEVNVEPAGGGAPLQTDLILSAGAGTINLDTGNLSGAVDLSAFAGQTMRVNFVWTIPEAFVGPGQFSLDNVLVSGTEPVAEIPTLSTVGFAVLVACLLLAAMVLLRRRQAVQNG